MNANEIVQALREECEDCSEFSPTDKKCHGIYYCPTRYAAALIESQAAQLAKLEKRIADEGFSDLETMISKYKTVLLAANEISIETDEEIETLKNQLAASQRRERAAAKCDGCTENGKWENEVEYGYSSPCTRCKRRCADNWRGQQEPEKGDSE